MDETDSADSQAPQSGELTAITRAYDVVREMTRRVAKFPHDFRFLLGDRILANVYEVCSPHMSGGVASRSATSRASSSPT